MDLDAVSLMRNYVPSVVETEDIPFRINASSARDAAVLVLLYFGSDSRWHVVLTKRSATLSTHPGETAFPGGKRDPSDRDLQETALREAEEEVALERKSVEILCRLEGSVTRYGVFVRPFVALIHEEDVAALQPNIDEVVEIFTVPLDIFLRSQGTTHADVKLPGMDSDKALRFFQFEHDSHVIFGITAAICIKTALIMYQKDPEFPFQYPFLVVPSIVNKL